MVNSATAEALRPGVLTTVMPRVARRRHVDVDRPAARHGDELEARQALIMRAGQRREMRHQDLGVADESTDLVRIADILLEPVHAGAGIAMLHRLVGPGEIEGADVEAFAAGLLDRRLETCPAA